MKIFDRWGEIIYESESITQGWNGTYLGKPVQEGEYFYLIMLENLDKNTIYKSGSLLLLK
jgi:gliding motility-associated-like protein